MSNLGLYQWITTASKKVGGPDKLLIMVAGGGYAVLRCVESAGKFGIKMIKKHIVQRGSHIDVRSYTVHTGKQYMDMVTFEVGDTIRVLDSDKDVVLVEKVEDDNNPYFLPVQFLKEITDY